jgi:diguanylate cyclase (GGDEF)-like protein
MGLKHSDAVAGHEAGATLTANWPAAFRTPDRSEVVTQFATRYLFVAFAVIYFSMLATVAPVFLSLDHVLLALGVYFVVNSWLFRLALKGVTLPRVRAAMATDLVIVTLCVIHDPNAIPPSALAFLMVLLGNGMRYGMRLFAEVLGAAVLGITVAFALRYGVGGVEIDAGQVFFGVFWVTLALYAYLLMGRIETQRHQLDYRSRYDMLTGLLNRHGLLAAAEQVFEKSGKTGPVTVLFADLNKFKSVNDRYGHGVGDMVLTEFARMFGKSVETGVCGRWGGDEFIAILPFRDDAVLSTIYTRIESDVQEWCRGNGLPMAVSLGAAHAPDDGHDLMTLLGVADVHLYKSKLQPNAASGPHYRNLAHEPETA